MSRYSHWNRRRWGRDSLTGGRQHSILASIGGFLLVPAGVGLAGGLAAKALGQTSPQQVATTYAAAHLSALAASWYGAKKVPALHSFLRGAMWGEGVVGTLAVAGAASVVAIPVTTPGGTVSAANPNALTSAPSGTQASLMSLAQKLIEGGFVKR